MHCRASLGSACFFARNGERTTRSHKYRSTKSRGRITSIPRWPEDFRRSLSPLTTTFDPTDNAQARNLSSSGSAHTCACNGGQSRSSALRATNARNGVGSTSGYFAVNSFPTRPYSVRISSDTANSNRPSCHASRIVPVGRQRRYPTQTHLYRARSSRPFPDLANGGFNVGFLHAGFAGLLSSSLQHRPEFCRRWLRNCF
jgi:hypothetical protein